MVKIALDQGDFLLALRVLTYDLGKLDAWMKFTMFTHFPKMGTSRAPEQEILVYWDYSDCWVGMYYVSPELHQTHLRMYAIGDTYHRCIEAPGMYRWENWTRMATTFSAL